jgi:hypothetical protein
MRNHAAQNAIDTPMNKHAKATVAKKLDSGWIIRSARLRFSSLVYILCESYSGKSRDTEEGNAFAHRFAS